MKKIKATNSKDEIFLHTPCCHGHWELVVANGELEARCESCPKTTIHLGIKVPDGVIPICSVCGKK